jgi:hypothetical protein
LQWALVVLRQHQLSDFFHEKYVAGNQLDIGCDEGELAEGGEAAEAAGVQELEHGLLEEAVGVGGLALLQESLAALGEDLLKGLMPDLQAL